MKATWGETFNEESEVEGGDNDNLALMAKSDTDSDSDSSDGNEDEQHEIVLVPSLAEQVSAPTLNEGMLLEIDSSNVPSEPRTSGTHVALQGMQSGEFDRSVMPPNGSPDSSMATAPTSLSPDEGSAGSPSYSSPAFVDLSTLLADIRGRYTSQGAALSASSPTKSGLAGSDFDLIESAKSPAPMSLSDSGSSDDSMPLAELKKRARKQLLFRYSQVYASKIPCVAGPASHTRAHLMVVEKPVEDGKGGPSNVAGTSGSVNDGELQKLHEEIDRLHEENKQLKTQLEKNEETAEARHNDLMTLNWSMSPLNVSSPPISPQSSLVAPNV
ncbi:hypothetical protein HAX54_027423 [Datura stramonium]|uniref:Uncharacterized protein n=1 Tax=Datura stramonium TaxID=4076 RepID=A0ABS8S8S6_DATST|nr:hypothetical protein [Datura stramonium]